ncbi:MAG TPA: hypothetical protein VFO49_11375 [Nocardioides sp.]|nr:hypothetical protein [Nocardioides sp.]
MLPTLNGRIQTRIFMLATWGALITLLITPILPNDPDYKTTYIILATVAVLGVIWEIIYHLIQQFRWEKDWPTLFGFITCVNEGALVWLLLELEAIPGIDGEVPFSTFVIDFMVIWVVIWLWVNGPMRVPLIRWRFFGGRII